MKITLKNDAGLTKKVKVGFSWTFLFFGALVPVFRGDFKNFFRILLLSIATVGIYQIVACFTYNKKYIQGLIEQGYRFDEEDRPLLESKRYLEA